jgi:hypothetical protein
MNFANSHDESQRDSGLQPRVARNELPWESESQTHNPNGVAARRGESWRNPVGVEIIRTATQGSSFLATLGYETQSLWDCRSFQPSTVTHES